MAIELESAVELIIENLNRQDKIEEIDINSADGRMISEDIYAPLDNPPFNKSPLDGYALFHGDSVGTCKDNPVCLSVVEEVFAGQYPKRKIVRGEAIRIMTGAPIPQGADCIIKQEDTDYGMEKVAIYKQLREYDNFCWQGEDIKKDEKIIDKGQRLNYVHIGVLGSMGISSVKVMKRPRVLIMTTGDELCSTGETLTPGKIYDSNLYMFSARLKGLGVDVVAIGRASDDAIEISERIKALVDDFDLIVTTGGVSVGKKDIIHDVIQMIGAKRIFWRVNVKPGTPALFFIYKGKPMISLSGNPFAALATFELLVRPALAFITKDKSLEMVKIKGLMADDFKKKSPTRRFIRAMLKEGKVYLPKGHASGMLHTMASCNCFIDVEKGNEGLHIGDRVEILLL